MIYDLPEFNKRIPSREELQQLKDLLDTSSNFNVPGGSFGSQGVVFPQPSLPDSIWILITAKGNAAETGGLIPYSFSEVFPGVSKDGFRNANGEYNYGPLQGDYDTLPAYEINNNALEVDQIYKAWKGDGEYVLVQGNGGGCGVVAVYCQGNQLMVMYNTPVDLAGTYWCGEISYSFNCESVVAGTKACKEWPIATQQGSKRTYLCPGGSSGFIEETAVSGPYATSQACQAVCTTTTTTTGAP